MQRWHPLQRECDDVPLTQAATGVHSINTCVVLSEHCRELTMAVGILSGPSGSVTRNQGQVAVVAGATISCGVQLQVLMECQSIRSNARAGSKGETSYRGGSCRGLGRQCIPPRPAHNAAQAGDGDQAAGMQVHRGKGLVIS